MSASDLRKWLIPKTIKSYTFLCRQCCHCFCDIRVIFVDGISTTHFYHTKYSKKYLIMDDLCQSSLAFIFLTFDKKKKIKNHTCLLSVWNFDIILRFLKHLSSKMSTLIYMNPIKVQKNTLKSLMID